MTTKRAKKTTARKKTTVGKKTTSKRKPTKTQARTKVRTGTKGVSRENKRAKYPQEFKDQVIASFVAIGSVASVCKMYDVEQRRLKSWLRKAGIDPSNRTGTGSSIGSTDTDRSEQSAVASSLTAKQKQTEPQPQANTDSVTQKDFSSHEERKESLSALFAKMDARVKSEGDVMSTNALKALATGMAIVSDKLDILNRKEMGLPQLPQGGIDTTQPLPSNVKRMLPAPRNQKQKQDDDVVDGEVIYEGDAK